MVSLNRLIFLLFINYLISFKYENPLPSVFIALKKFLNKPNLICNGRKSTSKGFTKS